MQKQRQEQHSNQRRRPHKNKSFSSFESQKRSKSALTSVCVFVTKQLHLSPQSIIFQNQRQEKKSKMANEDLWEQGVGEPGLKFFHGFLEGADSLEIFDHVNNEFPWNVKPKLYGTSIPQHSYL